MLIKNMIFLNHFCDNRKSRMKIPYKIQIIKNAIIKLLITVVVYFDDRLSYNNGIITNCSIGKINRYMFTASFTVESTLLFFFKFKSTVSNGNTSLHNYNTKKKHKMQ